MDCEENENRGLFPPFLYLGIRPIQRKSQGLMCFLTVSQFPTSESNHCYLQATKKRTHK